MLLHHHPLREKPAVFCAGANSAGRICDLRLRVFAESCFIRAATF
jgi:hypothetical protein